MTLAINTCARALSRMGGVGELSRLPHDLCRRDRERFAISETGAKGSIL
jgi:hypothetical protein